MSGNGYTALAYVYDRFSGNIPYEEKAAFIDRFFRRYGVEGIVLDAGCGTGGYTIPLAKLGYDMLGVDLSVEMLNIAMDKVYDAGLPIQLLCQDLTELDLFGTVRGVVCMQDTLNHVGPIEKVEKVLARFSLFTEIGGLLIFDANTPYKHEKVLADNSFVFEDEECLCVWRNDYEKEENRVRVDIDVFSGDGEDTYVRSSESFYEYNLSVESLTAALIRQGYSVVECIDEATGGEVGPETQRVIFVAKKEK